MPGDSDACKCQDGSARPLAPLGAFLPTVSTVRTSSSPRFAVQHPIFFQLSMSPSFINRAWLTSRRDLLSLGPSSAEWKCGVRSRDYSIERWELLAKVGLMRADVAVPLSKFSLKHSKSPMDRPWTLSYGGCSAICPSWGGSWRSLALPVACLANLARLGLLGAQSMKHFTLRKMKIDKG